MNTQHNDLAALVLRLTLGTMFFVHGAWKVFTLGLPATVGFFESQGFPGWTAYAVVAAELVGGVLLIVGIQVRLVSVALIPILLGALKVHLPAGFVFSNPNGGWEYPAFLIAVSAVQALLGEGAYAIDRLRGSSRLVHA